MKLISAFAVLPVVLSLFATPLIASAAPGLNVDFGSTYPEPSASYGAASGQAGNWNRIGLGVTPLVDLAGNPVGVDLDLVAGTAGGNNGIPPANDDEQLLHDNFFITSGASWSVDLSGVTPGAYLVYLYAPSNAAVPSGDMLVNGVAVASIPGDNGGTLIEGISWVSVGAEVTDGSLAISGAGTGVSGLAGLQLVPLDASALNVDFGSTYLEPLASYGAASDQVGSWNRIGLGVTSIVDLADNPAGVDLDLVAGTAGGNNGITPVNDDEQLLHDNFFITSGASWYVDLSGVTPGAYRVYLYAPSNAVVPSGDMLVNGVAVASIPGDTGGALIEGISWASVGAEVTNGSLAISGAGSGVSGLAGLQLVPLPEPGLVCTLASGAGMLALLAGWRRRQRADA